MARGRGRLRGRRRGFPHPRGDGPAATSAGGGARAISPPTWGWPARRNLTNKQTKDFPTHVGMARSYGEQPEYVNRFPHPRGDGPMELSLRNTMAEISPPTWGWPVVSPREYNFTTDFPTHVGMARTGERNGGFQERFPHPRGDGPKFSAHWKGVGMISPPTWGWPGMVRRVIAAEGDFPTHVGMARSGLVMGFPSMRFPHPRGDGPERKAAGRATAAISPPTWGWPDTHVPKPNRPVDFPTHVGMARLPWLPSSRLDRFPHPRGDGPRCSERRVRVLLISPPTWGWPVAGIRNDGFPSDFPTHVGMARPRRRGRRFQPGFPHPRGDGPSMAFERIAFRTISPPTWGWPVHLG